MAEAARILNVDRKTALRYLNGGLLEWRNIAPPGSSRVCYRVTLESVMRMRTTYRTGPYHPRVLPRERQPKLPPRPNGGQRHFELHRHIRQ